ncbi:Ribonuclease H-like domain containing protein [Parasponia andersonii]|uniref:Ribonuclease H-like domain containing protein n=1 Tax=Parasponia andersonii TaxID=3476 RepID=A0A2P5BNJ7_PARAD|nr:Ribonuclease H-like domain containing protein [Parasponia andersonii]
MFHCLELSTFHCEFHCEVYELAKHKCNSFSISKTRMTTLSALIHNDVWEPSLVQNISIRWFVSFIDDCTRITWVYLLKQKSDVSSTFQNFFQIVKNQFGIDIKGVWSNNVGDYFNQILSLFFTKKE